MSEDIGKIEDIFMNTLETIKISQNVYTAERALFMANDFKISNSSFKEGDSHLKESKDVELENCSFAGRYPIWHSRAIKLRNCYFQNGARSAVWYSSNVKIEDSIFESIRSLRRCRHLRIKNVSFANAEETLWNSQDVEMENVTANGKYFAMNTENVKATNITVCGDYCFDGAKDVEIHERKDAFWNCENVTIYDSHIVGDDFGWNSKSVTLIRCTIESHQGMCYMDNLVMKDCDLINTDEAFEYTSVVADINTKITSIINPLSGVIKAKYINEIKQDSHGKTKPEMTKIIITDENRKDTE